jgi:hypothetical protein
MTNPRTALPAPVPSHPPEKGRRVPVNPLLPGFFPDPSVCRAGDRYYVANSTFEYFPGLPLHVSDDLETWTSIGAAINRAGPTDFSAMADSKGLYAPTIRQIRPLPAGITNRVGPLAGPRWHLIYCAAPGIYTFAADGYGLSVSGLRRPRP